jgi:hypothetical protein
MGAPPGVRLGMLLVEIKNIDAAGSAGSDTYEWAGEGVP